MLTLNELGAIVKYKPQITFNTERTYPNGKKAPDGIEIRFGEVRPVAEVRDLLKEHGFKFSEKQKIWYAVATPKAKELVDSLLDTELDADDTHYEKRNFWAKINSFKQYETLYNRSELMIKGEPPRFFYSKSQLSKSFDVMSLIRSGDLYFKKYYNKVVGEDEEIEDEESNEEDSEKAENETDNENLKIAQKLEELAEGMQKTIDQKYNSATSKQRPTAKRLRVAESMREDGRRLKHIQGFLYALSLCRKNNNITSFGNLKNIRSKVQAELIYNVEQMVDKGWSDDPLATYLKSNKDAFNKIGINTLFDLKEAVKDKVVLMNINAGKSAQNSEQDQTERKIKQLEIEIISRKIPGFFPTPKELVEKVLGFAYINESDLVLEPSAGKGDILDVISNERNSKKNLHAVEINPTLREILTLKGYEVVASDFLTYNPSFKYDRIIMNPPFEKGLDIDHVNHALTLLKPNGILVSIMGEGAFYRSFKKETEFREKISKMDAYVTPTIKEAFKNGFNSTGVSVRIIKIKKSGNDDNEELELLELEAQAELELLKMRIELQKKKQNKGLSGIDHTRLHRLKQQAWYFNDRNNIPDFF